MKKKFNCPQNVATIEQIYNKESFAKAKKYMDIARLPRMFKAVCRRFSNFGRLLDRSRIVALGGHEYRAPNFCGNARWQNTKLCKTRRALLFQQKSF